MSLCLYCQQSDGPFTSVEHIFPESLGNKEIVLPKGVVCDPCNNGPLSRLDAALLSSDVVQFLRAFHGTPTKKGKLPQAEFPDISIGHTSPGHVRLSTTRDGVFREEYTSPDGWTKWSFAATGTQKGDANLAKLLTRAVFKMAFGLMYLDFGEKVITSEKFNEIRGIILGKRKFRGFLAIRRRNIPLNRSGITYNCIGEQGELPIWIQLELYGVLFYTEMVRRTPLASANISQPNWNLTNF